MPKTKSTHNGWPSCRRCLSATVEPSEWFLITHTQIGMPSLPESLLELTRARKGLIPGSEAKVIHTCVSGVYAVIGCWLTGLPVKQWELVVAAAGYMDVA